MKREHEAGFTLLELLIGIGISLAILSVLVAIASHLASAAGSMNLFARGNDAGVRLNARLESEGASAWAVFVPATDVHGTSNADGHEIDFYTEDGAHRAYAWAYLYDGTAQRVTRYDYVPGSQPVAAERFAPVTAFAATALPASQLATADPLFAGANVTDVRYPFPAMPSARGGNGVVRLHIATPALDGIEWLASATAPTSFTVVVAYTPSPAPLATPTVTPIAISTPSP